MVRSHIALLILSLVFMPFPAAGESAPASQEMIRNMILKSKDQ
jgi:hypothetical protein